MKTKSGTRPMRRYSSRFCACGAQAIYAVQVLARTLGPGQSGQNRKIKLGKPSILCAECSRNANTFLEQLGNSSLDALDQVRRPLPIQDIPLFDRTEA